MQLFLIIKESYFTSMRYTFLISFLLLFTNITFSQYVKEKPLQIKEDVYADVELMPKFIVGENELREELLKIKLPLYAKQNNIYGTVKIKCVIDTNGNIIKTEIIKGLGYGCDKEAKRVVESTSGKWLSAKKEEKKVNASIELTIHFKPENDGLADKEKMFFKKGLKIYENKKYANALTFFNAATDIAPNYVDAHFYSGNCLFKLDKKEEACKNWQTSFQLGKTDPEKTNIIEYCERGFKNEQTSKIDTPQKLIAIDSTMYTKGFKFKDGIYRTFEEFKFNSPSIQYKEVIDASDPALSGLNFNPVVISDPALRGLNFNPVVIKYSTEDGLKNKLKSKDIWGYAKNGEVFVLANDVANKYFFKLEIIGAIMQSLVEITDYYAHHYFGSNQSFSASSGRNVLTVKIIDFETGAIYGYNVNSFLKILKKDEKLYHEYSSIKGDRKKKQMMFIYLKKYNQRHPIYFKKNTYN